MSLLYSSPPPSATAFSSSKSRFPVLLPPSCFLSPPSKPSRAFPVLRSSDNPPPTTDEWGEKSDPEPVYAPTRFPDADPAIEKDEWGAEFDTGNGTPQPDISAAGGGDPNLDLKRCLVDSAYGTELGFRASPEVRAEVSELVNQLEAANPHVSPTQEPALLDGNWVLLYTAFSELLPLLAVGSLPLLKVERISQAINSSTSTVENSITLSSPFATLSFSASATFEVRSPSRIQVQFKEGIFNPPEIKSRVDLPNSLDIFGQTISLYPVQQTLEPVQEAVAGISRALSGQPPLKVPIPGERSSSWLLITYLDRDLRIARGDGGLFVLAREGSPLLYQ